MTWLAAVRLSPVPPAFSETSSSGGPSAGLEVGDHRVAAGPGHAAVEERHPQVEALGGVAAQQLAHLPELGEHERPLADVEQLVDELVVAGQLARAAGQPGAVAEHVGRVVADLLEPGERGEHEARGASCPWSPRRRRAAGRRRAGTARPARGSARPRRPARSCPAGRAPAWRSALVRRSTNGWVIRRSRAAASPSPSRSIGLPKRWRKRSRLPSIPGLTASRIAHRSARRFSTGVPVRASFWPARSARSALAAWVAGFLIICASSATTVDHATAPRCSRSRGSSPYVVTTRSAPCSSSAVASGGRARRRGGRRRAATA